MTNYTDTNQRSILSESMEPPHTSVTNSTDMNPTNTGTGILNESMELAYPSVTNNADMNVTSVLNEPVAMETVGLHLLVTNNTDMNSLGVQSELRPTEPVYLLQTNNTGNKTRHPWNKKIEKQRLFSTKKKVSKRKICSKPTTEETNEIAASLLLDNINNLYA